MNYAPTRAHIWKVRTHASTEARLLLRSRPSTHSLIPRQAEGSRKLSSAQLHTSKHVCEWNVSSHHVVKVKFSLVSHRFAFKSSSFCIFFFFLTQGYTCGSVYLQWVWDEHGRCFGNNTSTHTPKLCCCMYLREACRRLKRWFVVTCVFLVLCMQGK